MRELEERTIKFSDSIISYCRSIKEDTISRPIISQLIRSATSIGANYHEADEASSKRDLVNKLCIATKEAKETKYWIRVLAGVVPKDKVNDLRKLWQESQELNAILAEIVRKNKTKK